MLVPRSLIKSDFKKNLTLRSLQPPEKTKLISQGSLVVEFMGFPRFLSLVWWGGFTGNFILNLGSHVSLSRYHL